jgi:hypothetical protein
MLTVGGLFASPASEARTRDLLGRYGLSIVSHPPGAPIPGSYWGEPEAGITPGAVHVRPDTPVHSLLHEACHVVCMDADRRARASTDAGGCDTEESAVCFLQLILAQYLPGVGARRMTEDMDAWGYSFRRGTAARWFEEDSDDALDWLRRYELMTPDGRPSFQLRR